MGKMGSGDRSFSDGENEIDLPQAKGPQASKGQGRLAQKSCDSRVGACHKQ